MTNLPQPTTEAGRTGLAALLADPTHAVAGLDYDGTLSAIVQRPEDAVPEPGALEAIRLLSERLGAVVLISGRPAEQLLEFGRLRDDPAGARITILGQYGLQRWDGATGTLSSPPPLPGVARAREELQRLVADPATPDGVSLEDKSQALVLHTRRTSDPAGVLAGLRARLDDIAVRAGLEPHPARNALELRPPGYEKGGALRRFVAEASGKAVLFAGDDVGDLPAFQALAELRAEGIPGLGVLSGSDEVSGLREYADLVLGGPGDVVAFLRQLADALG